MEDLRKISSNVSCDATHSGQICEQEATEAQRNSTKEQNVIEEGDTRRTLGSSSNITSEPHMHSNEFHENTENDHPVASGSSAHAGESLTDGENTIDASLVPEDESIQAAVQEVLEICNNRSDVPECILQVILLLLELMENNPEVATAFSAQIMHMYQHMSAEMLSSIYLRTPSDETGNDSREGNEAEALPIDNQPLILSISDAAVPQTSNEGNHQDSHEELEAVYTFRPPGYAQTEPSDTIEVTETHLTEL